MTESKTVRIVPVPNTGDSPTKTGGTQVWCGDQRIKNVQKLTLIAEPCGVWRAVIEVPAQIGSEIVAEVEETQETQEAQQTDGPART